MSVVKVKMQQISLEVGKGGDRIYLSCHLHLVIQKGENIFNLFPAEIAVLKVIPALPLMCH